MPTINKITLIGYVGAAPEVRTLPSGDLVANFSVATHDRKAAGNGTYEDRTEWHRVSLYRRQAEIARQLLQKGSLVYVEGKLRSNVWTDRQGIERRTWLVLGDHMVSLGRSDGIRNLGSGVDEMAWLNAEPPVATTGQSPAALPAPFDDDIPF